jgi:tetratricopeptide (TPR) repeat protein
MADLRCALWDELSLSAAPQTAADAVFTAPYQALLPDAARALRLLSCHPGSFTLPAVAALIGLPPARTAALLEVLVGTRLLEAAGPDRYRLHALQRAYAADRALREDDRDLRRSALGRLAGWYLRSAHAASRAAGPFNPPVLELPADLAVTALTFADGASALRWYREERASLLAVARVAHTADAADLDQIVWQLPVVLHSPYLAGHLVEDWVQMATLGLTAAVRLGDRQAQARLYKRLGGAHLAAGRLEQAIAHHTDALNLGELGEQDEITAADHGLGLAHLQQRDLPRAQEHFERTRERARHPDLGHWLAPVLSCLAALHIEAGDAQAAADLAEQALAALDQQPDAARYLRVDPLLVLARRHREFGRFQDASLRVEQAADLLDGLERPALREAVLRARAELATAHGRHEQALEITGHWLAVAHTLGDPARYVLALDHLGCALRALGRGDQAVEFLRGAAHLSRHQPRAWPRALILTHLADNLAQDGESEQAASLRTEAYEQLKHFLDPRAAALRTRVRPRTDAGR